MFGFGKKNNNIKTENNISDEKGWVGRLKKGLSKTSSKFNDGLKDIFIRKKLDEELLSELEELLLSSDMGIKATDKIINFLRKDKFDKEVEIEEVKKVIAQQIELTLAQVAKELIIQNKPQIILVCGVNGSGKTTTIGKLANQYQNDGKKVLIASCDTFRAAANEQLEIWAQRSGSTIITGSNTSDPASVAFNAVNEARNNNFDILLIDTAGRLQNKANLMQELAKIIKVIKKIDQTAPHNSVIVLDATTGQNAHSQVKTFNQIANLTGLIITKLDGTAKGGVVVSLAEEFKLPIYALGVGETIDDLRAFEANKFAANLVGID